MATITVADGQLEVDLSRLEEVESLHGRLRIPLAAIKEVQVVDRPLDYLGGVKLAGAGLPGTAVGTWLSPDGKTFAVEHHSSRGVVLRLEGQSYSELILGSDDPEGLAQQIHSGQGAGA
ncbi:MAG: PH domain-containing protein [Candidatus Dormibacteria bacterium]